VMLTVANVVRMCVVEGHCDGQVALKTLVMLGPSRQYAPWEVVYGSLVKGATTQFHTLYPL
jgi:hypothetical protein